MSYSIKLHGFLYFKASSCIIKISQWNWMESGWNYIFASFCWECSLSSLILWPSLTRFSCLISENMHQFHMTEFHHWKLTPCFRLFFFSMWLKILTYILEKLSCHCSLNANMHILTSGIAEQRKPVLTMPRGVCCFGRISYCHSCIIANTPVILRKLMLFFLTAIRCHQKQQWVRKYFS